jgi:uncharacterized protein YjbI with pentapeptide repeats
VEEPAPSADDRNRAPRQAPGRDPAEEELQVRQTAQSILADHLKLPKGVSPTKAQRRRPSPQRAFWPGISLDLTGAALVDFNFASVSVVQARFSGATFEGFAQFDKATFGGDADFSWATFQGDAEFGGATFMGIADFDRATFGSVVGFGGATFGDAAGFGGAIFELVAWFEKATFERNAGFDGAAFQGVATFSAATFEGGASFDGATFEDDAVFDGATFVGDAVFDGATFAGGSGVQGVAGAQVLHLDDPDLNKRRMWPHGYIARPDPADRTRGILVQRGEGGKHTPAALPPDPTGR